jgi:hypothetical protein
VSITGKADGKSPNADKEIGRLKIVWGKGSLQHYRNDSTFKTYWTTTYQQELNTQGVRWVGSATPSQLDSQNR